MHEHDLETLFLRFRDAGDMRALAKLFDFAAPELLPVAAHLAARRDEADDLIQATFLTAIERADSFERGRPVLPWLLGILALHARKLRQREGRVLEPERVHQPSEADPERLAAAAELERAVDSACSRLPESYSGIVRRHLVDGTAPAELAHEFGLSNGAARVRLHRGLKLLRRSLPVAFARGAHAATGTATLGGLASVRAAVLECGSRLSGSPVPAAGFAPLSYLLAILVPLGLALPLWWAARWSSSLATPEPSAATAVLAPTEAAPSTAPILEPAFPEARVVSAAGSGLPALAGDALVRGRALQADGTPAAGASLAIHGRVANEERRLEHGVPLDWHDPAPIVTAADGRFEFAFDPPRAFAFDLVIDHAAAARAQWDWYELAPDSTTDLGDVTLEACATIVARVLDANGAVLCSGWRLSADAPPPIPAQGRKAWRLDVRCTEGNGEVVLERVPARRVKLAGATDSGATTGTTLVELTPGAVQRVDLVYTGPDLARRITVVVSAAPFHGLELQSLAVLARPGGSAPLAGTLVAGRVGTFAIDGCEPGAHELAIEDPRFASWTQAGVQPGAIVRAKLAGSAALRLVLRNLDGTPYAGGYALRAKFRETATGPQSAGEFTLVDPAQGIPEGGLVDGLLPGHYECTLLVTGAPAQSFSVAALAAHELREVTRDLHSGLTLRGRVLTTDGSAPLSGAEVQLTRGAVAGHSLGKRTMLHGRDGAIPGFGQSVATDAAGEFAFAGLSPGTWTVRARWGLYLWVDRTLELDAATAPLEIRQPEHGFLSGRLLVPPGAPLDDTALSPSFQTPWPYPPRNATDGRAGSELNADGTFRFGPLPTGVVKLSLKVTTRGADSSYAAGIGTVHTAEIRAGEECVAEIDLSNTFPGRLEAAVTIDDHAATGGEVTWQQLGGEAWGGRSVDLDGTARLGSLTPGTLRLTYQSADKTWAWCVPQPVAIAAGQQHACTIEVRTTERDLRCIDVAGGAPLADVEVEWLTGAGGEELVSRARTDAHGILHLRMPDQQVGFRCVGDPGDKVELSWGAGTGPLSVVLRRAP